VEADVGDAFHLQDELSRRILEFLQLPLGTNAEKTFRRSSVSAHAYELFLRANHLARDYEQMPVARDLYLKCVEEDPGFAPAWARLGRAHRLIGKYLQDPEANQVRAEEAFRRALELEPDLSVAHKFYAHFEAESGGAERAMVRLLERAKEKREDAELFAGLVHACRYCGLFEQSIAAHEEAQRLDPNASSSVEETILMTGDLERLLTFEHTAAASPVRAIGLGLAGRRDEARRALAEHRRRVEQIPLFVAYSDSLLDWLERRPPRSWEDIGPMRGLKIFQDPEAIFQEGWLLCDAGLAERGLPLVRRAVEKGYSVAPTLARSRAFDALRGDAAFRDVLAWAEGEREKALATFRAHGGEKLLGR
jgi:tetratricopeptide (TPR) repeat protein